MRCAIPHPCIDSSASVLKISKSSVPCSKSEVAAIFPSTFDNRMLLLLSNVKGSRGNSTDPFATERAACSSRNQILCILRVGIQRLLKRSHLPRLERHLWKSQRHDP